MNTGDAILADIREHPDDISLRRIYADWLDDHGDGARAEFIRVQLDLAALGEWDDARPALEKREAELLAKHRTAWLEGMPSEGVAFEGGLPQRWHLHAEFFRAHAQGTAASMPLISLGLVGLESDRLAQVVAESPLLDRVQTLSLASSGLSGWNAIKLLQQRSLSALRDLTLSRLRFTGSPLQELLRHPAALRLERLDLSDCELRGTDFEHLAQAPSLGRLQSLLLSYNSLGPLEMGFLSSAPYLAELRHLWLMGGNLTGDGLRTLARTRFLPQLALLDLSQNALGGHLGSFFASPQVAALTCLRIAQTNLNFDDVQQLVRGAFWPNLTYLDLSHNELHPRDLQTLVQAATAPTPGILWLDNVGLNTETARALAPWPGLGSVRELSLQGNRLDAHGLRALLFSPQMGAVRSLELLGNPVGNLGARVLARWPGLAGLRRLGLHGCQLDDEAAQVLLEALPPGVEIDLAENPLAEETLAAFRARHPLAG
jgi:uncharacterized protein (TIGR02996 family)